MLFSRSFVLGLFSYLRQAELSLDRAPEGLKSIRESLLALESLLEMRVAKSHEERIRIRLDLSDAEELVWRKLGRHARQVELVEHLNQNSRLATRPLSELAGASWPEST